MRSPLGHLGFEVQISEAIILNTAVAAARVADQAILLVAGGRRAEELAAAADERGTAVR